MMRAMNLKDVGIVLGLAAMTVANLGAAAHKPLRAVLLTGHAARDVRIYGQRLESDPRPGVSPVVVQNNWEDAGDKRFVVARQCVRPLTNSEYQELFRWGSR